MIRYEFHCVSHVHNHKFTSGLKVIPPTKQCVAEGCTLESGLLATHFGVGGT